MLEQKLEQDIKSALLSGDTERAGILKFLKAALLNSKVANNTRDIGLSDDEVISIFMKEAKKRQESADLYAKAGDESKAAKELQEKQIIEEYLPEQLSEDETRSLVAKAITETSAESIKDMGRVIAAVKSHAGSSVDGALLAKVVKEHLK